jgi:hypothetical protein
VVVVGMLVVVTVVVVGMLVVVATVVVVGDVVVDLTVVVPVVVVVPTVVVVGAVVVDAAVVVVPTVDVVRAVVVLPAVVVVAAVVVVGVVVVVVDVVVVLLPGLVGPPPHESISPAANRTAAICTLCRFIARLLGPGDDSTENHQGFRAQNRDGYSRLGASTGGVRRRRRAPWCPAFPASRPRQAEWRSPTSPVCHLRSRSISP